MRSEELELYSGSEIQKTIKSSALRKKAAYQLGIAFAKEYLKYGEKAKK